MTSNPINPWQIDAETMRKMTDFIWGISKITANGDWSHELKRCLLLGRKVMTNLDSILKSRDIASKGPSSQGYGFSSGHVWMWELDCEESWAPKKKKNWCFWTVVLEKALERPLYSKEIQPAHPKGNQSWILIHWNEWCWSWNSNNLVPWFEELTHLKKPWCWKWLKAGGEGDDRGRDGWIVSLTQRTWDWVVSGDEQGSLVYWSPWGLNWTEGLKI